MGRTRLVAVRWAGNLIPLIIAAVHLSTAAAPSLGAMSSPLIGIVGLLAWVGVPLARHFGGLPAVMLPRCLAGVCNAALFVIAAWASIQHGLYLAEPVGASTHTDFVTFLKGTWREFGGYLGYALLFVWAPFYVPDLLNKLATQRDASI